ncbi:MAG: tetratricopeptide repeat protein [Acidobacteriota bacterium]|nr:tetratricopeptide repeat protein [Acidobacteriota bacterium]
MARGVLCIMLLIGFHGCLSLGQTTKSAKPKSPLTNDQTEMRLQTRLEYFPHDAQAHKQLSDLLIKRNAARAFVESEASWLKDNPSDYESEIMMRSWATASLDDPDFALAVDKIMLTKNKREDDETDYDFLADRYAFTLLDRGRNDEAIALLLKSAELAPDADAVWANLGSAYERIGEYQKAIPYLRKALDLRNSSEMTHAELSKSLLQVGDIDESETEIRVALSVESSEPTDDFHRMLKNINKATKSDATASGFHVQLAKIYAAEKKFDLAMGEVNAAEAANSNDISLGYLKAQIWDAAHDPARAATVRKEVSDTIHAEFAKEAKNRKTDDVFSNLAFPEAVMFMENDPHEPGSFDGPYEAILLLGPFDGTGKLKPMDKLILGLAYCEKHNNAECRRLCQESMRDNPKFNTAKKQISPPSRARLPIAIVELIGPIALAG